MAKTRPPYFKNLKSDNGTLYHRTMSIKSRAIDWLKQAESDLAFAHDGLANDRFSHICFMAQQSGEKAIKSIGIYYEYEIRGHSIAAIAKKIGINGEVEEAGKILDLYYISARYPDSLPGGAPFEMFTKKQALEAISLAQIILKKAFAELNA